MDQAGIIRDLLIWLEGHLDQPLSLDNVAAKAGYSKWHLQRMFKDVNPANKDKAQPSRVAPVFLRRLERCANPVFVWL